MGCQSSKAPAAEADWQLRLRQKLAPAAPGPPEAGEADSNPARTLLTPDGSTEKVKRKKKGKTEPGDLDNQKVPPPPTLDQLKRHVMKLVRDQGFFDVAFCEADAESIFERYFAQGIELDLNDEKSIDTHVNGVMRKLMIERSKVVPCHKVPERERSNTCEDVCAICSVDDPRKDHLNLARVRDALQAQIVNADNLTIDSRMPTIPNEKLIPEATRTKKYVAGQETEVTIINPHAPEASRLVEKPTAEVAPARPALEKFLSYHILREAERQTEEINYRVLKEAKKRAALEEIKKAEIKKAEDKVEGPKASVAKSTDSKKEKGMCCC